LESCSRLVPSWPRSRTWRGGVSIHAEELARQTEQILNDKDPPVRLAYLLEALASIAGTAVLVLGAETGTSAETALRVIEHGMTERAHLEDRDLSDPDEPD
jgi:hypothetical protein